MITIESRSHRIDLGEVSYHYQEEPYPGGFLFTVRVFGTKRDELLDSCLRILAGADDAEKIALLLEALTDTRPAWSEKKYLLNNICTIDIGADEILMEVIGSPLIRWE